MKRLSGWRRIGVDPERRLDNEQGGPSEAFRFIGKALMRETERIAGQINCESGLFRERLQSAEAREAFAAFAERRQPDFSKLAS
jgi:1,4-dihydroxy-2-naphthoyl-CoA synthase